MTKFRLIKRARGWVIQERFSTVQSEGVEWIEVAAWRFRLIAKLHLLWLRERNRP